MSTVIDPIEQLAKSEKRKKRGRKYEADRYKVLMKLKALKEMQKGAKEFKKKLNGHFKRKVGGS